ncbi:MAG: F0F1 ATP synthase subunit epsilon [Alphaproteobacteria bacterium]|nr:F0F1 ATP synthase subunit epsilon [Alphaproteobacteria bacterium]
MKLKVTSPIGIVLKEEIQKIDFEALDGHFTLLPRHQDFVTAMPPNIVAYQTTDNQMHYMACNRGILVKKGDGVYVSVHRAVLSETLNDLASVIAIEFKNDDEQRKEVNTAMARLEVGLSRGFMQLKEVANNDGI